LSSPSSWRCKRFSSEQAEFLHHTDYCQRVSGTQLARKQKIIRAEVGLLELAEQFGNIGEAGKMALAYSGSKALPVDSRPTQPLSVTHVLSTY
jgi:hypothetical protein